MPIWVLMLIGAAVCSYVSTTVLSRNNPGEPIGWWRPPSIAPMGHLGFLAASVALAWLGGSFAAETPLMEWGYLLAALMVAVPWLLVRARHNRAVG